VAARARRRAEPRTAVWAGEGARDDFSRDRGEPSSPRLSAEGHTL
jgi:hypothetical protein